jgi:hypothetical protein
MNGALPEVITLKAESSMYFGYDNHPIATTKDHVGRIARKWHMNAFL